MPVQRVDRRPDQLDPADALEGVVRARRQHVPHAVHGGQEVCRAEPPGHLLLRRVRVHGDDPQRARDPRPLQDVQPDPARADHQHTVPAVHLRPVEHGADAGQHPAPDERGGRQRNLLGDPDRLHGLHDGPFREGRVGRELEHRPPVPRERLPRPPDRLLYIVGRPRSHCAHVPQLASVDRAT